MQGREMTKPYWDGKRVRLRAIEPKDAQFHFDINCQNETGRNLEQVYPPSSLASVEKWTSEAALTGFKDGDNFHFEMESLDAGETVGTIDTHHCDPRVGVVSYGLAVHENHRRKGYASDAICLVLRYYFLERRYQKANVGVFSFNEDSQRLHERLGFVLEGRQRRTTYSGGEYHDLVWYGITAEEFRERHSDYLE